MGVSNSHPPKWAERFLKLYCRPEILEETLGDIEELYFRKIQENKQRADRQYIWNVIRFFRWKNIRRRSRKPVYNNQISGSMIKNLLVVALRNFSRQLGHSLLNVGGLAIAFICSFLVLAWVTFEFSFDRFHADADRLFRVVTHASAGVNVQTYDVASVSMDVSSVPEAQSVTSVSTGSRWPQVLCFRPEQKERDCIYTTGVYASDNFFQVFNFEILHGDKNPLAHPNSVAISEKTALTLFNSADATGKTMKVDGTHEVVVRTVFKDAPANSSLQFDFVLPFAIIKKLWGIQDDQFNQNFFETYIRTNQDISAGQLTSKINDVQVLTEALKQEKLSYQAVPMTDWRTESKFENGKLAGGRIEYIVLFSVVGILVLAMAIINFINMTTARATMRAKEIGVRKVNGAFRSSIIIQFIGESFLTVLLAFIIAVVAVQLILPSFSLLVGEKINVRLWEGWMPVYLFAFLIAVSLLAGLYPAFVLSSFKTSQVLKGQNLRASGSQVLRKSLMVVQLAVSTGIIIFSGVLYLQLDYIAEKNLGFDRQHMIRLEPTYKVCVKFDAFKNELARSGNVLGATAANMNPLSTDGGNTGISWAGKSKDARVTFRTLGVTPEFASVFGLKITSGRDFLPETRDTVHTEVLVSEDAVRTMGLQNPVGEIITMGGSNCVIIGVVNNFHTGTLREQRMPVILYRTSYTQISAVYIRYKPGNLTEALSSINAAYKQIEPDYAMNYWFQDDTFNDLYKTEIVALRLIGISTGIAMIISLFGIAGLATYNTMRRTKEIGIRRVLGATVPEILSILMNEFSWVVVIAASVAAPIAWYAADQWLSGFANRIDMPWWIYVGAFFVIILITGFITVVQGFRTAAANPTTSLRSE